MLKFKKKYPAVLLVALMFIFSFTFTGEYFIETLTIGTIFSSFYFTPIYLIVYGIQSSLSRDMLKQELTRFSNLNTYYYYKIKEQALKILLDVLILIIGASLIVLFQGGTLRTTHVVLYYLVYFAMTLLYSIMVTWSVLSLRTPIPIFMIMFTLSAFAWLIIDANPFFNPFVSIYTVFTRYTLENGIITPSASYDLTAIIGYFVSLSLLFILFSFFVELKDRRLNL